MRHPDSFDVLVIGGGHAGTEAALAAARAGARTLLLTQNVETLGAMSCNPAIGGIGKSHLVREIDALGGAMARAADRAALQLRVLNGSKGPAVRATRAQADRALYRRAIRTLLENQPGLLIFQQEAADLIVEGERVRGAVTASGIHFGAASVVLTAGTFLGGRIHVGLENFTGGRAGDPASNRLATRLRELMPRVGRLKTGTPPRIDGRSVDYSGLTPQESDRPLPVLSYLGREAEHPRQIPCHITATNERTHALIRAATDRSPLYTGVIEGVGPRYCPSIEDKVVRFADRRSHQIFIEPEGLDTHEVYPNGISTSLPFDVQLEFVRSVRGFERAHLTRPGYAIEYDYFDPRDLRCSLETRALAGLYFAGQINGTTGYEEAAAQGLVAGLNAAACAGGSAPIVFDRAEAYLGVMIDDLVTRGVTEPYRMFTSRAEYRLTLRADNADQRLTDKGIALGCVGSVRGRVHRAKMAGLDAARAMARDLVVTPSEAARHGLALRKDGQRRSAFELLSYPDIGIGDVARIWPCLGELPAKIAEQLEIDAKYDVYLSRQAADVESYRRDESVTLPDDLDYAALPGLSNEVRHKLEMHRPRTIGHAGRIDGITPAALTLLVAYLRRQGRKSARGAAA
jgi:tRNA uridine 5-carboxymethylaminomethyl modification enzyme